jgi:hypothetical protein
LKDFFFSPSDTLFLLLSRELRESNNRFLREVDSRVRICCLTSSPTFHSPLGCDSRTPYAWLSSPFGRDDDLDAEIDLEPAGDPHPLRGTLRGYVINVINVKRGAGSKISTGPPIALSGCSVVDALGAKALMTVSES